MNKKQKNYIHLMMFSIIAQLLACTPLNFCMDSETTFISTNSTTEKIEEKYLNVDVASLKPFVAAIVEPKLMQGCQSLSQGIIHCYIRLQRGEDKLPLTDLLDAAPELAAHLENEMNKLNEMTIKAIRPSAGAPIVGPGTCDLKPVIDLLRILQCTLDECCEDILNSLTNITVITSCTAVVDLSGVFTVLADIKTTITDCCTEIIDNQVIIINTLTTCCSDLHSTITTCCSDIIDTITSLDISVSCTALVDLSGVFTVLENLRVTLTTCCENIGNINDLIPGCTQFIPPMPFDYNCLPSTINSEFNTTDFNVIQWLKAIYARLGQLSGF